MNCKAPVMLAQICIPYMRKGSKILNISSASAFQPNPYINLYAASKAFERSYSRALNVELKERKITVTTVCPGPVDTEFFDIAGDNNNEFKKKLRVPVDKVVDKAIRDAALGNEVSVYVQSSICMPIYDGKFTEFLGGSHDFGSALYQCKCGGRPQCLYRSTGRNPI